MRGMKLLILGLLGLLSAVLMTAPPSFAAEEPGLVVGRIYHIEGDLLRYVPEEKDWVATVPDAPFGTGDTLFSGSEGMAELIIPNGVWIRAGNVTQIQFIALDADLAEMDVASGTVRIYGKGQAAVKVTSPFGYVQADPGTIFDVYVGENSIEVVAIKGTASFVHSAADERYDVAAGATSVLADMQQVSTGDGDVDPDWNRWNMDRENFWLARAEVKGPSAEYLPPQLRNDAYVLEENGSWETVTYEGQPRRCWRPTRVAVGWSPFTVGRWTDWYGDQTWIPAEPFGYVTHHYGNWIFVGSHWYWAPPVVVARVGVPLLNIGFFWSPGRVAWIHSGIHVGWVPLAPFEPYYSRRPWGGRHTVVVSSVNITGIHIDIRRHAFVNHAVIVNRENFYGRNNYRNVRVTNINRTTIINNYQAAPVVTNNVIRNYSSNRQRFNFTNAPVREKPHSTVVNRIRTNERVIQEGRVERAPELRERLKTIPAGRVRGEARVEQPRGTSHIVPVDAVNRPKAELKLPEREIKRGSRRGPAVEPGRTPAPDQRGGPARPAPSEQAPGAGSVAPALPLQPGQPARPAEQRGPGRSGTSERETPGAGSVAPAPPAQPGQPARPAEQRGPGRSGTSERETPGAGSVAPAPPAQPGQPAERVAPARPAPPERRVPRPGRVAPARPPEQPQPAQPAQPATPARPAQPGWGTPGTGSVSPAQPAQPGQTGQPALRVTPAKPAQTEPVSPRRGRIAPAGPAQPPQPQTSAPPRPMPQPQPAMPSERVIPARPMPAAPQVAPVRPMPSAPAARQVAPATPATPAPAAPRTERGRERTAPSEQERPEQTAPQQEQRERRGRP